MSQRYSFLSKQRTELLVVFSSGGMFVILLSRRARTKMLRDNKVFVGRARTAQKDYDDSYRLELLREWWESIDEKVLYDRIYNAPKNKVTIVNFDNKLFINFNESKTNSLIAQLFLENEPIPDQDD